jgi:hypothetical protein
MAGLFDVSDIAVVEDEKALQQKQTDKEFSKSVLSPDYRAPRGALGAQEIGGMAGAIGGGILGALGGPVGAVAGSALGAGIGGAAGEMFEQAIRDEKPSASLAAQAGLEEAAWDLGGNLVLKSAGKVLRFGADKLGFTQKDAPDANIAAQKFLEQQGSSLPLSARTGSNVLAVLDRLSYTPATFDIFNKKQKEISNALQSGSKDILTSLVKSPEFEQALRSNTSSQYASGEILQNFIKQGQDSLGKLVKPEYDKIFADQKSTISTFGLNSWAGAQLTKPASLTAGQKSILNEIKMLPPNVDMQYMHDIRSRWLAENRDKYASATATEKDSRASKTISTLIEKIDGAMDASAKSTLDPDTYKNYLKVTNTYREGVQGLQSDAITKALTLNAEEVGGHLFKIGNETPIKDLYKSIAAAGTLAKKPSNQIIDALRYGYLEAMVNTPENMLKFASDLEQNKAMKNTYDRLFSGTAQDKAIKAMNEGAKLGLVDVKGLPITQYQTVRAGAGVLAPTAAIASGYYFALTPEQQNNMKDNLGAAAIAAGGLLISQRSLAKALQDPKGARAITFLSTAKEKLTSPSAFTKIVVEPLVNILGAESTTDFLKPKAGEFDVSDIPIR